MPEYAPEILASAAEAISQEMRASRDIEPDRMARAAEAISQEMRASRDIEPDRMARAALDAAAPLLADAVARRILDHMETYGPEDGPKTGAWRRHFQIAARIASRAFSTREDDLRALADAVARGDVTACHIPEDGRLSDA